MDAKIIEGRTLPMSKVSPTKRLGNYYANSLAELFGYRDEKIKGKGKACGIPMSWKPWLQSVQGALVVMGNTVRGKDMTLEDMTPSVIEDFERVGAEVKR